jgi:phage gp36-like protein
MDNPIFSESDLGVGQAWLTEVTDGLENAGFADPIMGAITAATQVVADYTGRFVIPLERWRRLMQPVALHRLYVQLGKMPEAIKNGYEAAMKELVEIRDGKFTDLVPVAPPVTPNPAGGSWGSETKVPFRIP